MWRFEEKDGQVAGNVRGCGGITARPPQTLWPLNPTPFKIKFLDQRITWRHRTGFDTQRRTTSPEDLQKLSSGARDAELQETVAGENPRASTASLLPTNVSKQYVYFNVLKANSWSNYGFCVSAVNKEVRLQSLGGMVVIVEGRVDTTSPLQRVIFALFTPWRSSLRFRVYLFIKKNQSCGVSKMRTLIKTLADVSVQRWGLKSLRMCLPRRPPGCSPPLFTVSSAPLNVGWGVKPLQVIYGHGGGIKF